MTFQLVPFKLTRTGGRVTHLEVFSNRDTLKISPTLRKVMDQDLKYKMKHI